MKKPNINVSKKEVATVAGFAVVGAAAGLLVNKLTTKSEVEVEGDTASDTLDAAAADIPDDQSDSEVFVPGGPAASDNDDTEV